MSIHRGDWRLTFDGRWARWEHIDGGWLVVVVGRA